MRVKERTLNCDLMSVAGDIKTILIAQKDKDCADIINDYVMSEVNDDAYVCCVYSGHDVIDYLTGAGNGK